MTPCSQCGGENPPQFSFCGYCAAPLRRDHPAAPVHETRRQVTVVFSDLKGSTSLGERLDSEALREVMTRYFEEMSAALEQHGGTVEKFIGDAIMAVFGMPQAHEDDALRAVRAALEMKERLAVLNEELQTRWGVNLANRTGVNTGVVIASGDSSTRQRLVTGDTVNVAARLEQAAPAYEVLIGETTHRLVRDSVEVEEVEPLELKGKSDRVPAFRLLAVGEGIGREHATLPLIGREHELAELSAALESAVSGRSPRLVKVVADAGTGKSRLIEELMASTAEQGGLVVRGRCLPYGRGITFWPLVEIVAQAAGIAEDDGPQAAHAKLAAIAVDEAVAARVSQAVGLSDSSFPLDELNWGVRKLFESLALDRPLLVVFEDVHWAERALLDLVAHIATTATGAPVIVVCAARPELDERHPGWPDIEGAIELRLRPLEGEAVDQLVERLLGGSLSADVLARISTAAEGNPLFVEQLVAMFIEEGALIREGDRWVAARDFTARVTVPSSIDALLAGRLDLLPANELTVLESASVIGVNFSKEPVEEIVPAALVPVAERLGRIESRQLIRRAEDSVDELFRFHHVLIRDSAYNRLPKRIRSTLHARFARWAERVNRERGRELEFQEIMGFHLEQARQYLLDLAPLDAEGRELGRRAAGHLVPAGRRAFGRGDMGAAANLLRRSAELLSDEPHERLELLPDLGEALMEIGEFEAAQRYLDEAVAAAAELGDPVLEADAILTRLLVAHHTIEDLEAWRGEVQRETDRLIPTLDGEDASAVRAKAWRMVAFVHGTVGRWQETADALERAIAAARLAGDARKVSRLSASYVYALTEGPTSASEAIGRAEEVLGFGLVDRQAEAIALLTVAPLHAMSGDFDRARELATRGEDLLQELGAAAIGARTSFAWARIELIAGDPGAAEPRLRADFDRLTEINENYVRPNIAALLAKALFELGQIDEADRLATVASEIASPDDIDAQLVLRAVQTRVLAAGGRLDDARSAAETVLELCRETDAPVLRADSLADVAGVLDATSEERIAALEEARLLYEQKGHLVGVARVDAELAAAAVSRLAYPM
ncbi:MAG TPA: adenylate/guanylate cyclase domain-containing protein [Gaiellaceae bacterium]|nr:adenylate/guanylate cyclase domain-containing protein [Gaiellaceae bacterium]